jgi:hypothetical protein
MEAYFSEIKIGIAQYKTKNHPNIDILRITAVPLKIKKDL